MAQKISIQSIQVGSLNQYTANAIYIQTFHVNETFDAIDLTCVLVNVIDVGNELQVPDQAYSTFYLSVPVTGTMTLNQIRAACATAIIAYSPLFVLA